MPDKLPHIFLNGVSETIFFTTRVLGRGSARIPVRDHTAHGQRLLNELAAAWQTDTEQKQARTAIAVPSRKGTYLEFSSLAGHDLVTKSLENLPSGIRLLNVRKEGPPENQTTLATVYVPAGKEGHFLKRLTAYVEDNNNVPLAASIEDIRLAVLTSFWQDNTQLIPHEEKKWCEIWLRSPQGDEDETEATFRSACLNANLECMAGRIKFPERVVVLVKADDEDLTEILKISEYVAEFRLSKETAGYWVDLPNSEQAEWVENLLNRTVVNSSNVSVCVLDSGANNGHPLLSIVLADDDCHSIEPAWGNHDHHPHGHGTAMCGVAAYGDLQTAVMSQGPVEINHTLETVKIFPPTGGTDTKLWGHITSQAVSRAEIQSPDALRISCMAITGEDGRDMGKPSSWSAAIDAMTSGYNDDVRRMMIICAGNIPNSAEWANSPESNQTYSIHDPGQSWNALTVGAVTNKTAINNSDFQHYTAIAPFGGLSPFTTTSYLWDRKWPIKPEIVLEGGNAGKDQANFATEIDDLSVLTTAHNHTDRNFSTIHATSAATAEASRLAASIQAAYPHAWPETLRALMVHSAQWTDGLKAQFGINEGSTKTNYADLLRLCGYGVPNLNNAMYCANNSLTIIAQETIQPYDKKAGTSTYCTKDMHLFELPWPKDVLLAQRNMPVQLRVTLSYFVEPGPGEIGWKDRYRYPSHGLRFDLNNPNDTKAQFLSRLNASAEAAGDDIEISSGSDRWLIGSQARNVGSVHSDIWQGTAAEIATCNMIGIYPIIGWWRERAHLARWNRQARYSLIVSLSTPEQNVDIYTPVTIAMKTTIAV